MPERAQVTLRQNDFEAQCDLLCAWCCLYHGSDDQDRDFEHGTQHITASSEFYAFHSPSKQAKSGPLNGWRRRVHAMPSHAAAYLQRHTVAGRAAEAGFLGPITGFNVAAEADLPGSAAVRAEAAPRGVR